MSHSRYEELLAVYRDLGAAERAELDMHLAACPACAARLAAYQAMDQKLGALSDAAPTQQLRTRFYAALAQRQRRSQLRAWAGYVAEAAIAVFLIVGVWVVVQGRLHPGTEPAAGPTPTATEASTPSPTPATPSATKTRPPSEAATPVTLWQVHMIGPTTGWALTDGALLHTTDGGQRWTNVTPPGTEDNVFSPVFLDADSAWVASAARDQTVVLSTTVTTHRTANGGQSWESITVPETFPAGILGLSLSCTDLTSAWLLITAGADTSQATAVLLKTTDSGAHWERIASTEGMLPPSGNICFVDSSTGWVSALPGAKSQARPLSLLSVTRDRGRTWQPQEMPLPPGYTDGWLDVGLPTFFLPDQKEGILSASYQPSSGSDQAATILYTTQDGGYTWQVATVVRNGGIFASLNTRDIWLWGLDPAEAGSAEPGNLRLYRTRDGGQTWTDIVAHEGWPQTLQGADVWQLDFVSEEIGWALLRVDIGSTQLIKTEDGGRTWATVEARVDAPATPLETTVDGWTGTVVRMPPMAQFDDYFLRSDGEKYGIDGSAAGLSTEIEQACAQGLQVQVWGKLMTGVPDVGGRQIVVERLEKQQ